MKKIISVTVLTMLICFVLQCDSQDKKVNVIINYRDGETKVLDFTDFSKTESGDFLDGTYKYILEDSGLEMITVWNRNIKSMVIKYGSGRAPDGHTEICYGVSREGGIVAQDSTWTGYQDSTWTAWQWHLSAFAEDYVDTLISNLKLDEQETTEIEKMQYDILISEPQSTANIMADSNHVASTDTLLTPETVQSILKGRPPHERVLWAMYVVALKEQRIREAEENHEKDKIK